MCSEKIVRYPEYRLLGERVSGCGYLKMQVQPDELSFEMKLRGLWDEPLLVKPVYVSGNGEERKVGTMVLENGKGTFTRIYRGEQVHGQEAVVFLVWEKVRIPLDERREIVCVRGETADAKREASVLPEEEHKADSTQAAVLAKEDNGTESSQAAAMPGKEHEVDHRQSVTEAAMLPENDMEDQKHNYGDGVSTEQEKTMADNPNRPSKHSQGSIPAAKWEYLSKIYPHKRPFRDEREFLAIGPGDFAILSEQSYRIANNSFTLHGYYNFGHLLLTRVGKNNGYRYYVGVPGYFFDKEKQAAMMFGFESFEGVKDPAVQGDFGYYLLAVVL